MKRTITLLLGMLLCTVVFSQTNVSGNITADETWNLAGSPYIVTSALTIDAGVTLTIEASVEVQIDNGVSFYVYGTVNGTSTTITSSSGSPSAGIWNYWILYSSSSVTLTNSTIEYGKYIEVNSSAVFTMTGGTIQEMSNYGIRNSGTASITNVLINNCNHGVNNNTNATTNLNNSTIQNGLYGIYSVYVSDVYLNGTTIQNCNYGVYASAIGNQITFTNTTLTSNTYPVHLSEAVTLNTGGTNDLTGNTYDVVYIYHTVNSNNWTLPYFNVPYYFRTSYSVNAAGSLTIEPENILKFNYSFNIEGLLTADAGPGENIYFTSDHDDNWGGDSNGDGINTAPSVGDWYGIRFTSSSSASSVMRRCKVRYAGNGSNGGVSFSYASPTIDLCEFQQNYFGAYIQYASNPVFTNNTVGSSTLTPIAMSFEASPVFTNNVLSFSDNQYDAIGLIGGTLSADAHVIQRNFTTVSNITYYMLNAITVPSGLTLTIDPGIVIKSSTYTHRIIVEGKLVADGTSADWITFTSVKDDNFGNPGDTNKDGTISTPSIGDMSGIIFKDGYDPTSIMDYVRMKYTSIYSYYYSNGGSNHYLHGCAVATISQTAPAPAGPTISNCEFRESAYGISSYQASNPVVTNNSFVNITETPLSLAGSADPTYSGNTYTNCGINALGLIGSNVVVNGTISKRTVAGYTNITYVLLENITIVNGTYLDIDPGVVVKMLYKYWYIEGGFKINGTISENTIFTSLYDDNVGNPMDTNGDGNATTPNSGNWYQVEFRETSDDSYCAMTYTDLSFGGGSYGLIRTTNASPSIANTDLNKSSGFGVRIEGNSAPIFNYLNIQNCSSDPIAMSLTSNPTFSNTTFSANYSNGIFILEGTLSTNATLLKRNVAGFTNIAYIIDELYISSNAVLTLEEGIVIKFRGSYFDGIHVHGALEAIGTISEKIIFTSFKDDSAGGDTNNDGNSTIPYNTDWDGIRYYADGDDLLNKLIYCEARYGGGGYSGQGPAVVEVTDAYVEIDHVIFQQGNGSAIGIFGSANPDITNCDIYNFNSYPIVMAMFSNPTFSNNTLANVKYIALGVKSETFSQSATFPQRNFAGYNNITYYFTGATINSGTTITIPAGMVLKGSGTTITVNGTLEVAGTLADPVVFTDYRDDDYGNPADTELNGSATSPTTGGISFTFNDVSDDASYIDHAIIRYRQNPVNLSSASPTVSNSTFYKTSIAIKNSGVCAPNIINNVFDELNEAPISISLVSYPASMSGNILTGNTFRCIAINYETLTQDAVLPVRSFAGMPNVPYLFSSYTIGTGVTLTIDPGVVCKFKYNGGMTVKNGLIAEGFPDADQNIVFTSITDDFYGGDSNADNDATSWDQTYWSGIYFEDQSLDPLCRFDNCIFRNTHSSYGAIRTNSSSPTITNCMFYKHYTAIYAAAASNPIINYCDFYDISYFAINNYNQSFVINAENCWWGHNSGPTHAANPGGMGADVTDAVDYNPYGTSGAINPIAGDVSLNGLIQAYDASLILLYLVNPATYPLTATQLNVADVSGNGGVFALDASLILQYVVGINQFFASELAGIVPFPTSDVELTIEDAEVNPGDIFELPVSISNVSNIYGLQVHLAYDPEILIALDVENLTDLNATHFIDEEAGVIRVAFAGTESLNFDQTIFNIQFKANDNTALASQTHVLASYFAANETDLSWNVNNGTVFLNGFATGVDELNEGLFTCFPNPFENELSITYEVRHSGDVSIVVCDIFGQQLATIANGMHEKSSYHITWNGLNDKGSKLQKGLYFIKFESVGQSFTQKVLLNR